MQPKTQFLDRAVRIVVTGLLLISLLFSIGTVVLVSGSVSNSVYLWTPDQTFMDLFFPISFTLSENPYENVELGAIYPPLSYLLSKALGRALTPEYYTVDALSIRQTQNGRMLPLYFTLAGMLPLFYLLYRHSRGKELEKLLLILCLLFSGPMLYLMERANVLLWALALTLFFVLYHSSENKLLRELSLIALALAAALKLYPGIFGVLLLKDRRYASALRCGLYGVLAFFLPFFAYDGLTTFQAFIDNLLHGISVSTAILYRVDLGGVLGSIANWFGGNEAAATALGAKLAFPYLLVMLGCSLLQKQSWKVCLGLALISTLFPGFSFYYAAAFYILPVFLFIQSKEERKPIDLVYAVLMSGLLLTLMCPDSWRFVAIADYGINGRVLSSYSIDICKACEALLSLLMLGDGVAAFVKLKRIYPALSRPKVT